MNKTGGKRYIIFECSSCGSINIAKASDKTRTCTYCGHRNRLSRVRKLASALTASEAKQLAVKLKAKRRVMG